MIYRVADYLPWCRQPCNTYGVKNLAILVCFGVLIGMAFLGYSGRIRFGSGAYWISLLVVVVAAIALSWLSTRRGDTYE